MINDIRYKNKEGKEIATPGNLLAITQMQTKLKDLSSDFNIAGGYLEITMVENGKYYITIECPDARLKEKITSLIFGYL